MQTFVLHAFFWSPTRQSECAGRFVFSSLYFRPLVEKHCVGLFVIKLVYLLVSRPHRLIQIFVWRNIWRVQALVRVNFFGPCQRVPPSRSFLVEEFPRWRSLKGPGEEHDRLDLHVNIILGHIQFKHNRCYMPSTIRKRHSILSFTKTRNHSNIQIQTSWERFLSTYKHVSNLKIRLQVSQNIDCCLLAE